MMLVLTVGEFNWHRDELDRLCEPPPEVENCHTLFELMSRSLPCVSGIRFKLHAVLSIAFDEVGCSILSRRTGTSGLEVTGWDGTLVQVSLS
jgi:hypothetical protein